MRASSSPLATITFNLCSAEAPHSYTRPLEYSMRYLKSSILNQVPIVFLHVYKETFFFNHVTPHRG